MLLVIVKEHFDILLEVQEVLVFLDVLALVVRAGLGVDNRRARLSAKQQAHVDVKDDQELADGDDGELERDADCFHANLLNLDELAVSELAGDRRVLVVVDHEVDQTVQRQAQVVLELVLVHVGFPLDFVELVEEHVEDHVERLERANLVQDVAGHLTAARQSIV